MKRINPLKKVSVWTLAFLMLFVIRCDDFLETPPYGTTTIDKLSGQLSGAESLLIAAYSNLDGFSVEYISLSSAASNWVYGSIAGGDAYKGSDATDQSVITPFEIHSTLNPSNLYLEGKWITYYNGVKRANDAINAFQLLDGDEISDDDRVARIAEARFLRGFFHLELRKIFGKVPYIDETIKDVRVGNAIEIFPLIQEDFLFAAEHLPPSQDQVGRVTKGAAQAYYGIAKLYQPLPDYAIAKSYFDLVINSGRYELNPSYHDNFNADIRNSRESILEVQYSVNDGAEGTNGSIGDWTNYPYAEGQCCGFHQPSQNLVNAFKTDAAGLPLLDTYNEEGFDVTSDEGLLSSDSFTPYAGTLDPRLDWTVGRRGLPYHDWGNHPGSNWIRSQDYGGPYLPKKNVMDKAHEGQFYDRTAGWASFNANNLKLLRYADLLLYAAEAEVELGNLSIAQELVNSVRLRVTNPTTWVHTYIDPANPSLGFTNIPAANYLINPYPSGQFTSMGKEYARKAVRFERRLELAMEGHRFFDLVRWGIAAEEKNKYFLREKVKRTYMNEAYFQEGKNEYLPIPQTAIDLSFKDGIPTLEQHKGYQ
jgi:hypothetical protein